MDEMDELEYEVMDIDLLDEMDEMVYLEMEVMVEIDESVVLILMQVMR